MNVAKLARALVRDKVDVIHASGCVAIEAAQKATASIPIVARDDETEPIAAGFVATLARPGGNIIASGAGGPDHPVKAPHRRPIAVAGPIVEHAGVPVIADADTGYGNALNAQRAVREFSARVSPRGTSKTRRFEPQRTL